MASFTPAKAKAQVVPSSALKPTPKSILRTPSTKLGRRQREDDEEAPESPSKKRKVMFDVPDVGEVKGLELRSVEDTKQEVRKIFEAHERGDEEGYDMLKDIFAHDRQQYSAEGSVDDDSGVKPEELLAYVVALTTCVPAMGKNYSGLVKEILKCAWLGRDEVFVKAYLQFLAALVSAQGSYLYPVLSMFVEKFRESRPSSWTVPGFPDVDRETMEARLHSGLAYLIKLFPAATPVIRKLLASEFPYSEESLPIYKTYIGNMLQMREYATDIAADIMEIITDRLVKLDVQMQLDLDDLDDDTSAAVASQLRAAQSRALEGEDDSDESDAESIASDDSDADEQSKQVERASQTVQKMDMILETLFQLYTPIFEDPDSTTAMRTFEDLLTELTFLILPTYKSRHTQFILFHFSQRSHTLIDMMVGTLFNIAFQNNTSMVLRQSAVAYLASFASRGRHVPAETVRSICDVLMQHTELYRSRYEKNCHGPNLQKFTIYYALFQGLLYIFCFRWRDLIVSAPDMIDEDDPASYLGHDLTWLPGLREIIRQNIWSKFNPLKVCSPAITAEFARLASFTTFMFVHDKIDANRRVHLAQFASGGYANPGAGGSTLLREPGHDPNDESWLQLEPPSCFDPYQLPVSRRWVADDYISWKPIPGLDRQEENDEDSDDGAEMDEDEDLVEEDTATDDGDADER
ncbi:RNA polymerase I specific transcription initiation factor RRN3 superfamily [Pleurostoma richardsiae]|uniref:RNA polymerase I specific transcription initiation factor RRN3 superfamily n=1 Tax=Pleurostoma richardsiae TaxID=41990 RepID=A0AA38RSW4_9PEZI|nr:RNA polymerase I specific transcription initiation factor RRN3 superfamily [Pleurostoma richardsiae]